MPPAAGKAREGSEDKEERRRKRAAQRREGVRPPAAPRRGRRGRLRWRVARARGMARAAMARLCDVEDLSQLACVASEAVG